MTPSTEREGGTNFLTFKGLLPERRILTSDRGDVMSVYETIIIMLTFGILVIAIVSVRNDKNDRK